MKETWAVYEVMTEMVKRFNEMADEKELSIETLLGAVGCLYELEKARFVTETMQAASLEEQDKITATLERLLGGKHDRT